ncbi:AraC family transcriptional regulator [Streptomyces sp. NPDC093094]|uniref:AraC family transcriptional regulator n=1 Tax=Streptomyces sp. NPDC093094 TaxID=3366026 RepID=UPI00381CF84D
MGFVESENGTKAGAANGWARYWRDGSRPVEAMHAHFYAHVYTPHSHDTYSFGITDAGAQSFRCRGADHTSGAGMVMAFNPDEVHDGRAAAEMGYRYRIVHIGPSVVCGILADAADRPAGAMPLFVQPVLSGPVMTGALSRLHGALADSASRLVREELLTAAVLAMAEHGATRAPRLRTLAGRAQFRAAHRARTLLDAAFLEPLAANDLAEAAGCSRFALYRAFRDQYGMPPSAYQRLLRLRHARGLLTGGMPPADAAAAAGFSDQAHFNRWFKRAYGITPGTFSRAVLR